MPGFGHTCHNESPDWITSMTAHVVYFCISTRLSNFAKQFLSVAAVILSVICIYINKLIYYIALYDINGEIVKTDLDLKTNFIVHF